MLRYGRPATIFSASASPMPGKDFSSARLASLMLTSLSGIVGPDFRAGVEAGLTGLAGFAVPSAAVAQSPATK